MNKIIILAVIGGIIGVAVVRLFLLNSIQIIGWNLFWNNLSHFSFNSFKFIFKSETFLKCFFGFIIGAGAGGALAVFLNKK